MSQGEHVRQLEGKVETLQKTAEALVDKEEATRVASGGMAERLRDAESALHAAQAELDSIRCGADVSHMGG